MKLSEAQLIRMYRIFLSSGDDARDLRDRIDDLVHEAINPSLIQAGSNVRLEVDRWEVTSAERTRGENTNEKFVARACEAQMTMALLLATLGDGTKEELQAVLDDTDEELSAIWFVSKHEHPDTEVGRFLAANRKRLYYDRAGPPDDDGSWIGVMRVLIRTLLEAMKPPEATFHEAR